MISDFDTPLRPTRMKDPFTPASGVSSPFGLGNDASPHSPSPRQVVADRYIPVRESQDNSVSHFLLTTKENLSPIIALSQYHTPQRENTSTAVVMPTSASPPSNTWSYPQGSNRSVVEESPLRGSPYGAIHGGSAGPTRVRSPLASSNIVDAFARLHLDSHAHPMEHGSAAVLTTPPPPASNSAFDAPSPSTAHADPDALVSGVEPYTTRLLRNLFSDTPQASVLGIHAPGGSSTADGSAVECTGAGRSGKSKCFREEERFSASLGVVYETNRTLNFTSKNFRVISQTPERILDAADMIDDFYMNLMDWSTRGVIAVALQSSVYLWDSTTCKITQLPPHTTSSSLRVSDSMPSGAGKVVCSVSWTPDGQYLAVGSNDGCVDTWDVEARQVVRHWHKHTRRVGSLSWTTDGQVLASGSKDATIRLEDLRDPSETMHVLRAHTQEICGLRCSPHRSSVYLASGSNDNQLLVWDRRLLGGRGGAGTVTPDALPVVYLNQHKAAVKAIAWHPIQSSLLASGGGTDDKTLRFWNTLTGDCVRHLNTQSQVCGVLWNHAGTELVSSHGFSKNQLSIWKYPSLRHVADLTGHTSRVLHLCLSPDGETVASAAGDETIRFWRCFSPGPAADAAPTPNATFSSTLSPSQRGGFRVGGAARWAETTPSPLQPPLAATRISSRCCWSPVRTASGASLYTDPTTVLQQVGFR
ncbi:unnamed protein product [Phytomonas sp. EM1]|nr:unnamed protein product [Phytomonas sp. EM1]|eukprot:CCW62606.1 unnamed protein product [Phytomonas sp. isolate EM1]